MRQLTILITALILAACGRQEPPATPATVAEARQLAAQAPPAPAAPAAAPVDACALLPKAEAEAVLGALMSGPEAALAQGSLLGQCTYMGDKGLLMVSARPAHEFRPTVDYSSKEGGARPIDGLAGDATLTRHGVMIQPPGKPYFVVVFVAGASGADEATTLAAAGRLKL